MGRGGGQARALSFSLVLYTLDSCSVTQEQMPNVPKSMSSGEM